MKGGRGRRRLCKNQAHSDASRADAATAREDDRVHSLTEFVRGLVEVRVPSAMLEAAAMVSAVVPSLLLVWYFSTRDAYREPRRVLWTTFALGALAIIPVCLVVFPVMLLLEAVTGGNPITLGFSKAFFAAAIPEEAFKLAVLAYYAGRHRAFDEPIDGLVYGAAASLGFATLENVLYSAQGGVGVAALRAVTAIPMHAGCGALMGYYYGRSRFEPERRSRLRTLAFVIPTLLHALYDWPLLTVMAFAARTNRPPPVVAVMLFCVGVVFMLIIVAWMLVVVRRARRDQAMRGPPVPLPPEPPVPPKPASVGSSLGGAALLFVGGAIATLGGTFGLALLMAAAAGDAPESGASIAIGVVVFGLLPLAIGLGMFWLGIRLLGRPRLRAA
jgi:protease PrsW